MNILELDSFNLADAVKFNDQLNPRIWQGNKMRPEVREQLLKIAADFKESLGLSDLDVKDITVSGSNAGFTYTPHSDIDLHLVVRMPEQCDDVYQELFNAKKYQYNDEHDIKIGGYDVELYVQPDDQEHHSAGVYSVANDDWIHIPRKVPATADDAVVKDKYEMVKSAIESALKSKDIDRMRRVWDKVKEMRKSGLAKNGELGPENLAFKMLRTQGNLGELKDAIRRHKDKELSLAEQNREKKPVVYGHKTVDEDVTATPDGVGASTKMFLSEKDIPNHTEIIFDFMRFVVHELDLHNVPKLKIRKDPQWSVINKSFGRYRDDLGQIDLAVGNRHIMDVLRTLAHELQHRKQDEREHMPPNAGATGSRFENEAHAVAGVLMRRYADLHPEYFEDVPVSESASGYIPKNKKEAKMPQYAMALSVDIKPGETGRQANKMALKTDSQGKPALLMKTANMIGESRVSLFNWLKQQFPTWPDYVLKDFLYQQAKGIRDQAELEDFLKRNKQDYGQVKWRLEKLPITLDIFTPKTQRMIKSREGGTSNPFDVPRDAERHAQQSKMIQQQGVRTEPIIVAKLDNGYDLIEGWHRTIQHLKAYPQGYVGPAWVGYGATYQSTTESNDSIAEGKSYGYNSTPLSQVPGEQEDDLGNQEATGPEFPPQMPAGTTKIDVADLTDWYKLGQDISDLDDADPANYGKGPPQTVVVFPSDEAEQGYLKQFKRLGLKTHDMDPDVKGGEDVEGKHLNKALAEELQAFKEQDLFEVKMTSKNLAKLAKDIKGVKVGLEFEMIVPNATVEEEGDMEPDYDQDQRVRDIDDAVNFFDDGDYNSRNELRRLRENMESDFFDWQFEKIDELWNSNDGWDFFTNYLDREDPFDEEEAEEEARNELQAQYGDDITPEEFQTMLNELVEEKSKEYYQEQWDEQGRNYDNAREEFEEEQRDELTEEDWLDSQGIRYASDVESTFGHVTWPYYTSSSDDDETAIERIALDFMNGIGADSVAYSSSYHGRYKKWVGNGWVDIGSNKPDDCFAIEPDGSLEANDSDDAGLEFVSPPTPLEQVPNLMKRVQSWAADNGVYTGKHNKTSIHTNISVPGYDLDKLDYLKAALLLGDEYVLREFDRIGNTYAAPAIEKVKQLVQQKPEKAQELLDKMKSQLNAEASKLIHSGQTNKFTSINTKDNRVEFRSPGGDYLSIIADNPQKMIDTINRMVVTLDAAMDPNKYKEEYQKKLYKVLTGQGGGREAKSGLKQAMKASDKDLLNIFSRYAAGELPRAALKSFVRQAQLERRGKKADAELASHNWAIRRRDSGDIVRTFQADDYMAAHEVYKQYKQKHNITDDSLSYGPYNPTEEKPEQQPQSSTAATREYEIFADGDPLTVVRSFYAADDQAAQAILDQYRRDHPGTYYRAHRAPVPGSTLDLQRQRQRAAAAQQNQGNWGIWITSADRFANQPGEYPRGAEVPLYRFPSREAAEQWIEQQRAERPRMRTDIEVREIEPREPLPDLFPELPGTPAAQQGSVVDYELYNRLTDEVIDTFPARNDNEAMTRLNDYRQFGAGQSSPDHFGVRRGPGVDNTAQTPDQAQGGLVDVASDNWSSEFERRVQQPATGGTFTGEWKVVDPNGREIYRFGGVGNAQSDANRVAMDWLRRNPRQMQAGVEVLPVMA